MNLKKIISLHPCVAAGFELLIGGLFLWWLRNLTSPLILVLWIVLRAVIAAVFVYGAVYYPPTMRRSQHYGTLIIFYIGLLGYLLFLDWPPAWYILGGSLVIFPAVSFWLIPSEPSSLSFVQKPFRRWCFLMTVMSIAGFWNGLIALFTFQIITLHYWWLVLVVSAFTAGLGGWWWLAYELPRGRRWWLSLATLFFVMSEFTLGLLLWPLGYFGSSLLLTWWWYVLWLILRFYNSPEGIIWRRQTYFLAANIVLTIIYLIFIIRWH